VLSVSENWSPDISILSGQLWRVSTAAGTAVGTAAATTTIVATGAVGIVTVGIMAAAFGVLL